MNLAGCFCVVGLGLVVTGLGQHQTARAREHVIDLTTAPKILSGAVPEQKRLTPQGSLITSPRPEKTSPIRVLAPQLDRADYRIGQPFFFDVIVENAGSTAIKFPTLLDESSVDRQMAGATLVVIGLSFKDEVLGLQTVSPHFLYGARDVPGSLITVPPHEFVRIRAQGQWLLSSAPGTRPDSWPRSLQIEAIVAVSGNGITPVTEISRETVPVVLRVADW